MEPREINTTSLVFQSIQSIIMNENLIHLIIIQDNCDKSQLLLNVRLIYIRQAYLKT